MSEIYKHERVLTALYNIHVQTLGHRKQVGRPTVGMLTHVIDPALLLTPYGNRNYLIPSRKLAKFLKKCYQGDERQHNFRVNDVCKSILFFCFITLYVFVLNIVFIIKGVRTSGIL